MRTYATDLTEAQWALVDSIIPEGKKPAGRPRSIDVRAVVKAIFYLALREFGRIERTLFTLDWLLDKNLRQRVTAGLNKGELKNTLVKAVCFNPFRGAA